jgi:hypothetical protein
MLFPDGVASDDLYALLGVSPKAPSQDLEIAWRTEVQRWHPDSNPDPLATSRTAFINVAHGILRDPAQRTRYDAGGLAGSATPRRDQAPEPPTAEEARWRGWEARWAAEEERLRRWQEYRAMEKKMWAFYSAREANGRRHFREALDTALLALQLRAVYERDTLQDASALGRKDWFPPHWSLVTNGLSLAAVFQDKDALDQIATVLNAHPELAPWCSLIQPARQSFRDVSAILQYVRSHPGTLQAKLGREIGQDQPEVAQHCWYRAAVGALRRERVGTSYSLVVP